MNTINSVYVLTSQHPNGAAFPILVSDQRDAIDNYLEEYLQEHVESRTVWVTNQYELSYRRGHDYQGNELATLVAHGYTFDNLPVSIEVRNFCVFITDFEAYQGE